MQSLFDECCDMKEVDMQSQSSGIKNWNLKGSYSIFADPCQFIIAACDTILISMIPHKFHILCCQPNRWVYSILYTVQSLDPLLNLKQRTLDLKITSVSFALATIISAAFVTLIDFHRIGLLLMLIQVYFLLKSYFLNCQIHILWVTEICHMTHCLEEFY